MAEIVNCLMLRTADKREFFTSICNLAQLIEFAKTYSAELLVVEATNVKLQNLPELVRSICLCNKTKHVAYKIVENKLFALENPINTIRQELLDKKEVSLVYLENKFNTLSKSTLNNYFSRAKKQLVSEGKIIKKLKKTHQFF